MLLETGILPGTRAIFGADSSYTGFSTSHPGSISGTTNPNNVLSTVCSNSNTFNTTTWKWRSIALRKTLPHRHLADQQICVDTCVRIIESVQDTAESWVLFYLRQGIHLYSVRWSSWQIAQSTFSCQPYRIASSFSVSITSGVQRRIVLAVFDLYWVKLLWHCGRTALWSKYSTKDPEVTVCW